MDTQVWVGLSLIIGVAIGAFYMAWRVEKASVRTAVAVEKVIEVTDRIEHQTNDMTTQLVEAQRVAGEIAVKAERMRGERQVEDLLGNKQMKAEIQHMETEIQRDNQETK